MREPGDLTQLSLTQQAGLLRDGECSSREIIDAHLARIERLDPKLHAFIDVFHDEARRLADAADDARAAGLPVGPLHGLPIGLKDLLDIEGRVSTAGSRMWAARRASTTATVVERLLGVGMIPLGKLHMVEFAFGAWGTNVRMGTPWNPRDLEHHRAPGGSSSGNAVAIAAGLVPAAIGSDTGGSVRVPAAFTGITALKVTYGRISLHGAMLLSWTLDSLGPMAKSVDDCAALLQAMAGADRRDPATALQPILPSMDVWPDSLRATKIALPDASAFPPFMHPAVIDAWRDAASTLGDLGAEIVECSLPPWFFELARRTGAIIATEADALHKDWIDDASKDINDAARMRVLAARDFAARDYAVALHDMQRLRQEYLQWSGEFDAVLLPTVATPAPRLPEIDERSPLPGFLTRPVNYLGLCALALPSGRHEGLPLGIQLIGRPYDEARILRIGRAFQQRAVFEFPGCG